MGDMLTIDKSNHHFTTSLIKPTHLLNLQFKNQKEKRKADEQTPERTGGVY
jgi:hypothetical protein